MLSIFAAVFVFGILVFVHELGHFLLAKKNGIRVEKFSFGFGQRLYGKKIGDTEYVLSAIPLGGYIKMAGDDPNKEHQGASFEFLSKSCAQRARVIAAGPILNYLLAFFLFSFIFLIGNPTLTTKIGQTIADYPAEEAGIKVDDVILAVDGEKTQYWPEMTEIIHQKNQGQEVVLDIKRGEELLKISLMPKIKESRDTFGQKKKVGLIGIYPAEETTLIKYGWIESFHKGAEKLLSLTGLTYKAFWFVLTLRLPFKESFAGPILIFKLTGSAASMGFVYLLNLMAALSMSLAIFNFLPLPVLDGGHLFFLLLEKLRKRPVSVKIQEAATQVGMLLLLTLFAFVSYYDVIRSGWLDKAVELWQKIGPK